jgi:cell division protein FtsW (lipid II flippase)
MNPSPNIRLRTVYEFGFLMLALVVVYLLSLPFSRLLSNFPEGDLNTLALYQQGFAWYAKLALVCWAALLLGRRHLPVLVLPYLVLALWGVFWALQTVGQPAFLTMPRGKLFMLAVGLGVLAFAMFPVSRLLKTHFLGRWQPRRGPGSLLAYPGFVMFTGIGWLWLMDYFVNGHLSGSLITDVGRVLRDYPLKHASDLGMTFVLLSLVAALAPSLLRLMVGTGVLLESYTLYTPSHFRAARANQTLGKQLLILTVIVALLAAFVLAPILTMKVFASTAALKQQWAPRITEWIRFPLLVSLAYLCYRWLDTQRHWRGFAIVGGGLVALAMAAFLLTGEKGQFLLCGIVAALIGVAAWFQYYGDQHPGRSVWLLSLLVTAVVLVIGSLALHYLPEWIGGTHVLDRVSAKNNPFQAREDFLAVFQWFGAEAGAWGFGLGQVPWCGYAVTLGDGCNASTGVPYQISSDYAFFGVAGVWGMVGAALITMALLLWLFSLMVGLMPSQKKLLSFDLLRGWLVGAWAVAMMVQVFLTAAGALGLFVLTGVPLPMLAMGLTSLLAIAVFVALAASQVEEGK